MSTVVYSAGARKIAEDVANYESALAESDIRDAKTILARAGYVVLKEASYRKAQERQRIAEALRRNEREHAESIERWARECCEGERRMAVRTSYLYALAKAHGASDDELAGGMEP